MLKDTVNVPKCLRTLIDAMKAKAVQISPKIRAIENLKGSFQRVRRLLFLET